MEFKSRLKALRLEFGLTQKQCAGGLRERFENYSEWENGIQPNFDTLCKIADYFKTSTDYLLGRTGNRHVDEAKSLFAEKDKRTQSSLLADAELIPMEEIAEEFARMLTDAFINIAQPAKDSSQHDTGAKFQLFGKRTPG